MPADPLAALADLPGVAEAVHRGRAAVDGVLAERILLRRSADVSAESALRGAWASAVLDGADLQLEDVRRGAAPDARLQGALRAQGEIGSLMPTWRRAPRQALARLHAVAAADLCAADSLGRPSARPGVAQRLDLLARVVSGSDAPALVVAAVVHGEVLALDAFEPVSGVVARAAARLTLVARGLDPKGLIPVEVGHLELRQEYARALAGYEDGTPDRVVAWIGHVADAVGAAARETAAICQALGRGPS